MINFHKVLITTAILFALGFAVWSGVAYSRTQNFWALASAIGFGMATVALVFYLKNLRRFLGQ